MGLVERLECLDNLTRLKISTDLAFLFSERPEKLRNQMVHEFDVILHSG
jgi:hypothetical protein